MTSSTGGAVPKRKRGHLRVAAIMQAAVEVFSEKGYDAATMTEIATRSATATASLYRFFPSKESLADALLQQHAKYSLGGLAQLRVRAAKMTLREVAGALVDLRLEIQSQRTFAIDLVDARAGGSEEKRSQFRKALLAALVDIIREVIPGLAKSRADVVAIVLIHILKAVTAVGSQKPAAAELLVTELKELVYVYLASIHASPRK